MEPKSNHLGSAGVTADGGGFDAFSNTLAVSVPAGWLISGTTTDASQNTSALTPGVSMIYTAQPSLAISAETSGSSATAAVISWPSSNSAYQLETTASLTPPVVWVPVTSGITDNGTSKTFIATNTPAITNRFYRLKM